MNKICKDCSQFNDCAFIDNGIQHRCGVISAYKRGFEDGIGHGWHRGNERPLPATGKTIIVYYKNSDNVYCSHTSFLTNHYEWFGVPSFVEDNLLWCYPPKED